MPLPPPLDVNEASPLLDTENAPRPRGGREIAALFKDSIPGSCAQALVEIVAIFIENHAVIFSYILQNSIQTVSIVIVGRLGPTELSVAAFSLMLAFVTG
jgi:MATE family multidrug resistance protein